MVLMKFNILHCVFLTWLIALSLISAENQDINKQTYNYIHTKEGACTFFVNSACSAKFFYSIYETTNSMSFNLLII